jgi:ferredoxin
MYKHHVSTVFFSPTDTSRKGAQAIAGVFGSHVHDIDMTLWNAKLDKTVFNASDIVVFGAPVYGGRVFKGARERFRRLRANRTPCIVTVTYGNRDYNDALLELRDLVHDRGFIPFAAAALIGEHTYGTIQVGRPDTMDLHEDAQFAQKAYDKLVASGASLVQVPGNCQNLQDSEGGDGGGFRPLTNERCISCGLCAQSCPEGAISFTDYSVVDSKKCIACFRCIRKCPVQAKNMDTDEYHSFADDFSIRLSKRRENEYFL